MPRKIQIKFDGQGIPFKEMSLISRYFPVLYYLTERGQKYIIFSGINFINVYNPSIELDPSNAFYYLNSFKLNHRTILNKLSFVSESNSLEAIDNIPKKAKPFHELLYKESRSQISKWKKEHKLTTTETKLADLISRRYQNIKRRINESKRLDQTDTIFQLIEETARNFFTLACLLPLPDQLGFFSFFYEHLFPHMLMSYTKLFQSISIPQGKYYYYCEFTPTTQGNNAENDVASFAEKFMLNTGINQIQLHIGAIDNKKIILFTSPWLVANKKNFLTLLNEASMVTYLLALDSKYLQGWGVTPAASTAHTEQKSREKTTANLHFPTEEKLPNFEHEGPFVKFTKPCNTNSPLEFCKTLLKFLSLYPGFYYFVAEKEKTYFIVSATCFNPGLSEKISYLTRLPDNAEPLHNLLTRLIYDTPNNQFYNSETPEPITEHIIAILIHRLKILTDQLEATQSETSYAQRFLLQPKQVVKHG